MSTELSILKAFSKDKEVYDKYIDQLDSIKLDTHPAKILKLIESYYDQHEDHKYISEDELTAWYNLQNPNAKHKEVYEQIISNIFSIDTSDSVAIRLIESLIEKDVANKIVQKLVPIISGESHEPVLDEIKLEIEKGEEKLGKLISEDQEDLFLDNSITKILKKKDLQGIEWRLKCLNDCLGPLPGTGKTIHVASRPNAGKTSLLSSEITHMISQIPPNQKVLWCHNEEDGGSVQLRWYQAMLNANENQINNEKERAELVFKQKGGDKLLMYDSDSISIEEIDKLIAKITPRIVVVDIADHVGYRGENKAGNGADRLKNLYRHYRNLGKKYSKQFPIDFILTGWSDATTDGKKWFGQGQLDGGKTAKPGSTDAIICIGQDGEGESDARYLSVCRNKLTGKGMKKVVTIDRFKSRFYE